MRTSAFVRFVAYGAGWLVHALGLLLLVPAAALLAASWPLDDPGVSIIPYERLEHQHLRQLWISPDGQATYLWGMLRARHLPRPPRLLHVYASLGRDRFNNPGHWFEVSYSATRETVAGGHPVQEYTSVRVHWAFIAIVGAVLAAAPLAARPSRVVIMGAYRWVGITFLALVRPLMALVPGHRSRPRGFEVISRH